jgi:hypothetical protein
MVIQNHICFLSFHLIVMARPTIASDTIIGRARSNLPKDTNKSARRIVPKKTQSPPLHDIRICLSSAVITLPSGNFRFPFRRCTAGGPLKPCFGLSGAVSQPTESPSRSLALSCSPLKEEVSLCGTREIVLDPKARGQLTPKNFPLKPAVGLSGAVSQPGRVSQPVVQRHHLTTS